MAKRGPGRPSKPPHERRTVQINFKVTDEEFERIQESAGHFPVATWVRSVILTALKQSA